MPAILDDTRFSMVIIVVIMIAFPFVIWKFGKIPSSPHLLSPKQKRLLFVLRIVLSESLFGLILLVPLGKTVGGCDRMFDAPTYCPENAPAWVWALHYFLGVVCVVSLLFDVPLEFSGYFRRSTRGSNSQS